MADVIAWDYNTGQRIDEGQFPLGYFIEKAESNYHWNCWDPYGSRCSLVFTDPNGITYGPYVGELTWPYEEWPDAYPIINLNLSLNIEGIWFIDATWYEKLDGGWSQCGIRHGEFQVGEPITCEDYTNQVECETAGCYWYNNGCYTILPACEQLINQTDCNRYGCYWYNNGCHSEPSPPSQIPIILIGIGIIVAGYLIIKK